MKSFETPLPPTLFVAKEVGRIFDEMNLAGVRGLVDLRQWVREGLITPVGIIGRPSKTAPHVYSAPQVFLAAVLVALGDLGINERAVLGEVVTKLGEDLGGETLIERLWIACTRDIAREDWLMRVDVVRPEPGFRTIEVHVFDAETPNELRPPIAAGRYSGSLFVDLGHVAENVARGIAKVLASVEGED